MGLGFRGLGFMSLGFRGLRFMGLGFRGLGFMGLGFRGLGFMGLGFRGLGFMGLGFTVPFKKRSPPKSCGALNLKPPSFALLLTMPGTLNPIGLQGLPSPSVLSLLGCLAILQQAFKHFFWNKTTSG